MQFPHIKKYIKETQPNVQELSPQKEYYIFFKIEMNMYGISLKIKTITRSLRESKAAYEFMTILLFLLKLFVAFSQCFNLTFEILNNFYSFISEIILTLFKHFFLIKFY